MKPIRLGLMAAFGIGGWLAGAAVVATPAAACAVTPGSSCAPDVFGALSGTQVAMKTGVLHDATTGLRARWWERIYKDSVTGDLDWVVEVNDLKSSTDTLDGVSICCFAGTLTDMGYIQPPATSPGENNPPSGKVPTTVSRSADGRRLHWEFATPLRPGQSTVLLEVKTNSTTYVPGTLTASDNGSKTAKAYGTSIPEAPWVPALGLLGGAIAGRKIYRRSKRVAPAAS